MKACILAVLALVLSQSAFAQHYRGHGHGRGYYGPRFGVYVGSPFIGAPFPWFPPPAYYYPPNVIYSPVVTVREPPVVYIEQADEAATPALAFEAGYWYYCHERSAYFPTVTRCPGTWQKVAPSTANNR